MAGKLRIRRVSFLAVALALKLSEVPLTRGSEMEQKQLRAEAARLFAWGKAVINPAVQAQVGSQLLFLARRLLDKSWPPE